MFRICIHTELIKIKNLLILISILFFFSCDNSTEPDEVYGCTISTACNFNPFANLDDGSCFSTYTISIESDQFIGAFQFILTHGEDFSIELTDEALVADYETSNNTTNIIIVFPTTEHLFTVNGQYEIVDILAATDDEFSDIITQYSLTEECL